MCVPWPLTSSDQAGERVKRGCADHTASLVLSDCYYNIVLVERLLVVHSIKGSFRSVRGRHDTCQAARVNNEVPQKVDKTNSCKIVASEITADCALHHAVAASSMELTAPSAAKMPSTDSIPASLQFIYPQPPFSFELNWTWEYDCTKEFIHTQTLLRHYWSWSADAHCNFFCR